MVPLYCLPCRREAFLFRNNYAVLQDLTYYTPRRIIKGSIDVSGLAERIRMASAVVRLLICSLHQCYYISCGCRPVAVKRRGWDEKSQEN